MSTRIQQNVNIRHGGQSDRGGLNLAACLVLLVAVFICGGCGGSEPRPAVEKGPDAALTESMEPKPGGTLVVAWISEADMLNPVVQQSLLAQYINSLLFPNVTSEQFKGCALEVVPYLAHSWEFGDDGKSLTYHLRPDVLWSDGNPVTSHDLAFSCELVSDPDVASPRYNQMNKVERVETPDEHTAVFHFTEAYDGETQIYHTSQDMIPKHVLIDADRQTLRGNSFNFDPVGAGPFRLERWERNQEIILTANRACTLASPPHLDRVVFRVIPEYTTRLTELIKGTVDMMDSVQTEDVARLLEENPDIRIVPRGWRFLEYIGWNLRDPLFSDPKVRRALTMCIDRDLLIQVLLSAGGEAYGRPAVGTISPELCRQHNDQIIPLPHDPRAGKKLLADMGWEDRDRDGLLDRDGVSFSFSIKYNAGNMRRQQAVTLIQSQLKNVGIEARIEPVESRVLFEQLRQKQFQAVLAGWQAGLRVDPTAFWHSGEEYEFNFCSYANPEVDRLIENGLMEQDPERASEIWYEMQRIIYDDQPYTFLYWVNNLMGIHKRVRGVEANILSPLYGLERWWIEPHSEPR